jgi:hypothetical protein
MKSKVSVRSQNRTEELLSDHSRIIVILPQEDFMNLNLNQPVPVLTGLPVTLPREGAIEIELEQHIETKDGFLYRIHYVFTLPRFGSLLQ